MRRQDLGDELSADDLDRYASKAPKLIRRILAGQVIDVDWMPVSTRTCRKHGGASTMAGPSLNAPHEGSRASSRRTSLLTFRTAE
jgi:hypothetical protein